MWGTCLVVFFTFASIYFKSLHVPYSHGLVLRCISLSPLTDSVVSFLLEGNMLQQDLTYSFQIVIKHATQCLWHQEIILLNLNSKYLKQQVYILSSYSLVKWLLDHNDSPCHPLTFLLSVIYLLCFIKYFPLQWKKKNQPSTHLFNHT